MMKRIGKIVARGRGSSQCQEGLTEMIIMTICDDKKHLLEYQQLPPPHGGTALLGMGGSLPPIGVHWQLGGALVPRSRH